MFALIRGAVVQGASGPSAPILHTDGGWAGFILDNTQGNASISITALGRYKVPVRFPAGARVWPSATDYSSH